KPFYNIKLTDDKAYPLIEITKGPNPSVTVVRKKTDEKSLYFGPYSDTKALKTVLKLLRKIFPFQSVKNNPKRKCLYYHLGLCPCVLATPENVEEYKKNLNNIKKFLDGKKDDVLKILTKERDNLSKIENFEDAAAIQAKIDRINLITSET